MSTPPPRPLFTTLILLTILSSTAAQTCQTYKFPTTVTNTIFSSCQDLSVLNSHLHWTLTNTTNSLQIAYRHNISADTTTWIAWAINPSGTGMVGSQAFVAFIQDGLVKAYTSPVTTTSTTLAQGELSFPVGDVSGVFLNGEMIILANLILPDSRTTINQVWQSGPVTGRNPGRHELSGDNIKSRGTLDLLSGKLAVTIDTRIPRRNVHGILNVVSWGFMMPIGIIIARYLKVSKSADPAWFYLHSTCQSAAFIIGLAGFATGLKLGNETQGIQNPLHRSIGFTLVTLAFLQVLALVLHPNTDHKHRLKWSVYHRAVGYTLIILSIVNVFKGFGIIMVSTENRRVYVCVLIALAVVAAVLEVFTWVVVIRRGKREDEVKEVGDVYGRQPA